MAFDKHVNKCDQIRQGEVLASTCFLAGRNVKLFPLIKFKLKNSMNELKTHFDSPYWFTKGIYTKYLNS